MEILRFIKVETEKVDNDFSPSYASPSNSEKEYLSEGEDSFQTKCKPFANSHSPQIDPDIMIREGPKLNRKTSMLPIQRKPTMGYWFAQMEELLADDVTSLFTLDNEYTDDDNLSD